jgi:hypothetical protein
VPVPPGAHEQDLRPRTTGWVVAHSLDMVRPGTSAGDPARRGAFCDVAPGAALSVGAGLGGTFGVLMTGTTSGWFSEAESAQ